MKNTRMAKRLKRSRIGISWLLDAMTLRYLLYTGKEAPLKYFLYPPVNRPMALQKMNSQAFFAQPVHRPRDLQMTVTLADDANVRQRWAARMNKIFDGSGLKRSFATVIHAPGSQP